MLYPICPTCGALLSNIQLLYQKDINDLCIKHGIDINLISKSLQKHTEFNEDKKKIVDKYCDKNRYCCRMRLINFCDMVRLIE